MFFSILLLFSLFNMRCLVAQERVVLFECCILDNMTIWPKCCTIRFSEEMAYFNSKCRFVYTMKIHDYERTLLLRKYAHNVTTTWSIYNDCMFNVSIIENLE